MRASHTMALVAAAIGVPYAATETDLGRSAVSSIRPGATEARVSVDAGLGNSHREVERILDKGIDRYRYESTPAVIASTPAGQQQQPDWLLATGPPMPSTGQAATGGSIVGGPIQDLREVLRFDISPDWVTRRFNRVTTVLAETELEGLRVPLVTGITPTDLAGTLTYYFDHAGELQRVMLHGFTGDASRIVETMTRFYGLAAEPTLDAGVYTRRWNGRPVHFLRLTRAPVVHRDALHHKFTVFLELNQPGLRFGISPEATQIIAADRHTGRW